MKVVAAIFADFATGFLGGPSQLGTALGRRTVLGHALARLQRVAGLDHRCLFVQPRDQAPAAAALQAAGLAAELDLLPLDDGQRRRRELLRSARKWSLNAWRGSPLGTTWFDEFVEPVCVARVLDHYRCDAVLCLAGHQPVLGPDIATAMVAHYRQHGPEVPLVFTQAPPGLAGVILDRQIVRQLLEQDIPLGILLAYRPEIPRSDQINQPPCYHVDPGVAQTPARLTADTRRSRELLSAAFAELGDEAGAGDLCAWLRQPGHDPAGPLPLEVELELTTADPLPASGLRPRGERVPARHLDDLEALGRVADELAAYDDRLVFLGGHGDPLAHPDFPEVCRRLRSAGVCGLAVGTPLVNLADEHLEALFAQRVDLLQVYLDANSSATYRRVHGADNFERVLANIGRIEQVRRERHSAQPIVVCSLTRCAATLGEMEAFYDRWIRATGWALIEGYNDYGGALPADPLLPTRPALREPCRRLRRRLALLADGSAVSCAQDFRGEQVVGSWATRPIRELWNGSGLEVVRAGQASLALETLPVCRDCRDWFRP